MLRGLLFLIIFTCSFSFILNGQKTKKSTEKFSCGTILTDKRDNMKYKTIIINNQCWMAENLNTGKMIPVNYDLEDKTNYPKNDGEIEKYCFNNDTSLCLKYGALYNWDEMMQYSEIEGINGICPDGWHIPAVNEWSELIRSAGGYLKAGEILKDTCCWKKEGNARLSNSSGFSVKPAGRMQVPWKKIVFTETGMFSYTWSSTRFINDGLEYGWAYVMYFDNNYIDRYNIYKNYALSVRCILDSYFDE